MPMSDEETATLMAEGATATEHYRHLAQQHEATLEELGRLQQGRLAGTLGREDYVDYLMLEDKARVDAPRLVQLEREMHRERAAEAMTQALIHHDDLVPAVVEAVMRVVEALNGLHHTIADLGALLNDQELPIFGLRDVRGQIAFPTYQDARSAVHALLSHLDHTGGLAQLLLGSSAHAVTNGELAEALGAVSGAKPFPPRLMEAYLRGFDQ
jgi:hypothetical protein